MNKRSNREPTQTKHMVRIEALVQQLAETGQALDELLTGQDWAIRQAGENKSLLEETQAALKETQTANSLLSTLLEMMPVGVIICNAEGELLMTNPFGQGILGERVAGYVNQPLRSYIPHYSDGSPFPVNEMPLARAMSRGETVHGAEILIRRGDGSERTILASAAPIRDSTGQIISGITVFQDITERKKLEMALEKQRAEAENEKRRTEAVMEALPVGVAITDLQGGTIRANTAYEAVWGNPRPEAQSVNDYTAYKAWWVDTGKAVTPEEWASAQVVRKGESVIGQILEIQRFDGSRAFVINSAAPVWNADGEIVGSAVAIQDITDLRKVERALHESETRYRELFNTSRDGIIFTDMEGHYLQCNPAYLNLLGYETLEEIRERSYEELTPPEYHEIEARIIREQILVQGYCDEYEKEYIRKTGERIPVSVKAWLRLDADQHPTGMWVIVRDISERIQARQVLQGYTEELEKQVKRRTSALRASYARFQSIFEDAAIGIALVNQKAHVITGNPAFQRILGYSTQELKGMSLAALTHPGNVGDDLKLYNELISGQRSYYQIEGRYMHKDGHPIDVNVTVSLVQWQNVNARFAIVMLEDISARKRAQAALIQSEKLALTGKLAASLAHEINNPLQSVVGFMSLVEESLAEGKKATEETRAYVRIAIEEVKRAAELVHQMRNIHQPSCPEGREPGDINAPVKRALALTQKKCQEQHIEVIWKAGDDLPLIPIVPDRIQQVLLNLILNALDAMPDGGSLHIATAHTEIPSGVEIRLADDGEGMTPDDLKHLFEPFYTTKTTGMGLGLYVSHRIIQEHGGQIHAKSSQGKGTTFTVWLPAQHHLNSS